MCPIVESICILVTAKRSFVRDHSDPGCFQPNQQRQGLEALDAHSAWYRKDDIVLALLTKQKLPEWSDPREAN